MGSLRRRLRRLEEATECEYQILVCPECGEEFVAHGDVAVEFIAHEWAQATGEKSYRDHPGDVVRIFEHEHDPSAFVEKRSGLPFLSKPVSGMNLGVAPEDVEDPSEP